ncbi:MAG: YciI family protein [Acidobacteria bacterium]|nr:MAG: YciI family protein [Acidobacteriota bacterium]REK04500.1 MAG: YciI family protein [Acidobacteriota bacterium]
MRYLLMIYTNEELENGMSEEEKQAMYGEYFGFTEAIQKQGIHRAGEALQPVATATTVSVRGGKVITTDGPYAETKEQLGGFYLVETDSIDGAIAAAAKIPGAKHGFIEVRPIIDFD